MIKVQFISSFIILIFTCFCFISCEQNEEQNFDGGTTYEYDYSADKKEIIEACKAEPECDVQDIIKDLY